MGDLAVLAGPDPRAEPFELTAGQLAIVPKGVWHTARMSGPCLLLALADGLGTQHRPA